MSNLDTKENWEKFWKLFGFENKTNEELSFCASMLGLAYQKGDKAYREDPIAKKEIEEINKKIYEYTT